MSSEKEKKFLFKTFGQWSEFLQRICKENESKGRFEYAPLFLGLADSIQKELDAADARIAELLALVENLPMTVDGHRRVWDDESRSYGFLWYIDDNRVVERVARSDGDVRSGYSTREAAEAASKKEATR